MGSKSEKEIDGIKDLLTKVRIDYNTGKVYWLKNDMEAGTKTKKGYTRIETKGVKYMRHRVIFYSRFWYLPDMIDHIKGVDVGDFPDNLRPASTAENNANHINKRKNNTSGSIGVYPRGSRFSASIQYKGKRKHLGSFATVEEAQAAYNDAAKDIFGNFHNEETNK